MLVHNVTYQVIHYVINWCLLYIPLETTLHYDDKLQQQLETERMMRKKMAQELDTLRTRPDRQGVETKDVAVQFSVLQPVSGTITLYHCNTT